MLNLMGNSHLGSRFSSRNIYLLLMDVQQSKSWEAMFHVIIYDSWESEAVFQSILPQNFW